MKYNFINVSSKGVGYFIQVAIVLAVVALVWMLSHNIAQNLLSQNIATGFGFLEQNTGFEVNQKFISYDETSTYARLLLVGVINTVVVSMFGIIGATFLGFFIAIMRLSNNWLLSKIAGGYVELFRNTPLLIQLLFWYGLIIEFLPRVRQSYTFAEGIFLNNRGLYIPKLNIETGGKWFLSLLFLLCVGFFIGRWKTYRIKETTGKMIKFTPYYISTCVVIIVMAYFIIGYPFSWDLPYLKGFNFKGGINLIPEFLALWFSLVVYTAVFIAEIVRSGINSVQKGQIEAARSLGLSITQSLKLIVIPQALRVIIPPLTSQYLNLTKNSSLAAAVAYPEIVSIFTGTALNQTGQAVEIIFITMVIYLILSLSISIIMNRYNQRISLIER